MKSNVATSPPVGVEIVSGTKGFEGLQDQFVWIKEYFDQTIPGEVRDSFYRLNKIAVENNADFRELCVYAMDSAAKEEIQATSSK